jgi:hypothetical protein
MRGQEGPRATKVSVLFFFIKSRMLTTKVAPEFNKKESDVTGQKSDQSEVVRGAGLEEFTPPTP